MFRYSSYSQPSSSSSSNVVQTGLGGALKRSAEADAENNSSSKRPRNEEDTSVAGKVHCDICNILVSKRYFANHLKSNTHKNNILKSHNSFENVCVIESAFGQRIITYKIKSKEQSDLVFQTPESFLDSIKSEMFFLIDDTLKQHATVKINFVLHADFVQQTKNISNSFDFQTNNFIVSQADDLNIFVTTLRDTLANKISSFEKKDSGWSLTKINYIELNINKFNPLRGTSYIDLPKDIKLKKAVINVQNSDNLCFKWALLSALYPVKKHTERPTSYSAHVNMLKFDGVSFPIKLTDISKIEKQNNISINVFGLEFNTKSQKHSIVGPLYFTKSRKSRHVNLLYLQNGNNGHYCYIKSLSRLVSKQLSNTNGAVYLCDGCLLRFTTADRLTSHQQHDCSHIKTILPNNEKTSKNWFGQPVSNDTLQFDKFEKTLRIPFVVYADFEAFLNPIQTCAKDPSKPYTINVQKHEPYSFGYYIKCAYDDSLSKYETCSGPDCVSVFINKLYDDLKIISRKNCFQKTPKSLSTADSDNITNATICHICETNLNGERFLDFDWQTGDFRGVAHEICEKKFRAPRYIPVFVHNLSNYDAHFIVHALNSFEGEVDIIPQNKEKYISFTKHLTVNNQKICLRFVDSFKFLPCSLDQLAKNLKDDNLCELKNQFPAKEDFVRLRRKGVYPYEFMTSYECLNLTSLPNQDKFYSSLNDTSISDEDYNRAQDVWQHFNCQNMLDYSNLYLKTDVLLLADIFENFRALCLDTYGLDPTHYYTAPGLSWDAMLKKTKVKLELLTDIDQIAFIKSGIRGGVSQCSNRHAKANNKFLDDFDEDIPASYLAYFDANNLYGWAMSQFLPERGFEWVSPQTDFNVSDTSKIGYILEVDLDYPKELHDLHSDLPLCPENICAGESKEKKLIPNLKNKSKYIIHYRNLKQCLKMGLKLSKIHRILKFEQSSWLQKYIDLNTELRTKAVSDFEKDFFKLMNNSVFGKTMENVEKRVNVKLLTHWENRGKSLGVQDLIAKPEFRNISVFSENLVAVQLNKTKVTYDKPIYLGFSILDISKILMYDFHYEYILKKFDNKVKLMYTDTDSLIYQIFTENFYEDIKPDIPSLFDTSSYPTNNIHGYPQINKKKLGFFKDENNGEIVKEFVGLRSKMYAIQTKTKLTAKAKGVNKCITQRLSMKNYKSCLLNRSIEYSTMYRFRSIKHTIFTQQISKISLSCNDTKRHILPNNVDTLAWGHYKLQEFI